ncbi:disease resistance protein RGA2-like [Ricinus communis]|uniref:disease resistance protein RGA2-like n=1 Tax=Ricinus communis TaxID=3988 RepID=UPI00201AE460|nr:disease resistance protein RGA2-like [Ricinus communis]
MWRPAVGCENVGKFDAFQKREKEWLFVQNSELWKLGVCHTGVLQALRLNYLHLPSHLKDCFSFCSIFPKRYEIQKEKVIRWMAAGLILSDGANKPPEVRGDEYFQDLLWMSFFQDTGEAGKNGIKRYRMHDIVHDLAQSITRKESVILEQASLLELPFIANMINLRHLNITGCEALTSMSPFFNGRRYSSYITDEQKLRTISGEKL